MTINHFQTMNIHFEKSVSVCWLRNSITKNQHPSPACHPCMIPNQIHPAWKCQHSMYLSIKLGESCSKRWVPASFFLLSAGSNTCHHSCLSHRLTRCVNISQCFIIHVLVNAFWRPTNFRFIWACVDVVPASSAVLAMTTQNMCYGQFFSQYFVCKDFFLSVQLAWTLLERVISSQPCTMGSPVRHPVSPRLCWCQIRTNWWKSGIYFGRDKLTESYNGAL